MRLGALLLLALLLTTALAWRAIDLSMQHGRLSVPPLYDDVSYFVDGARWLNAIKNQGAVADIAGVLRDHAPFSTLVAAIGLRLFPESYVGPYVVHAVVVFAFLLGIIRLTWTRPMVDIATCLVAAACVPNLWHTVTEARPDLPSALMVGLAAGAIAYRGLLDRGARSLAALGVACGLAVSIKPTSFPASLFLLASVFAIRLLFDCIESGGLRASIGKAITTSLWFSLALLATVALLIGPALIETIAYILKVLGSDRDLWSDNKGFWIGLLRFSVGGEGKLGLHLWFYVGLALMVLRFPLAARQGRAALHDAIVVFAAVLIAYAIPSLAEIKTYFYGAIFYGVFIVAMTLNFCADEAGLESLVLASPLGAAAKRHLLAGMRVVPLAVVALVFVKTIVTGQISLAIFLTEQQQEGIRMGTQHVWSLVRDVRPEPSRMVSVGFSSPYPVTPSTIQLYAEQAQMKLAVRQELFHRTVEATEAALLRSDIIVVSSTMPHNLPGPRQGDELIQRMDANKSVCLLDSLSFPDVRLRVYRRPC